MEIVMTSSCMGSPGWPCFCCPCRPTSPLYYSLPPLQTPLHCLLPACHTCLALSDPKRLNTLPYSMKSRYRDTPPSANHHSDTRLQSRVMTGHDHKAQLFPLLHIQTGTELRDLSHADIVFLSLGDVPEPLTSAGPCWPRPTMKAAKLP